MAIKARPPDEGTGCRAEHALPNHDVVRLEILGNIGIGVLVTRLDEKGVCSKDLSDIGDFGTEDTSHSILHMCPAFCPSWTMCVP